MEGSVLAEKRVSQPEVSLARRVLIHVITKSQSHGLANTGLIDHMTERY